MFRSPTAYAYPIGTKEDESYYLALKIEHARLKDYLATNKA